MSNLIGFISKAMHYTFSVENDVLESFYEEVKKISKDKQVKMSDIVNEMIKDWLAKQKP